MMRSYAASTTSMVTANAAASVEGLQGEHSTEMDQQNVTRPTLKRPESDLEGQLQIVPALYNVESYTKKASQKSTAKKCSMCFKRIKDWSSIQGSWSNWAYSCSYIYHRRADRWTDLRGKRTYQKDGQTCGC